ncbi:hypothetical protein B0H13DRAFT_922196 [Mycena leptocephala]|nr:hypothetical protein B0H13DRAFT_922196 [Mycena leptocephala]
MTNETSISPRGRCCEWIRARSRTPLSLTRPAPRPPLGLDTTSERVQMPPRAAHEHRELRTKRQAPSVGRPRQKHAFHQNHPPQPRRHPQLPSISSRSRPPSLAQPAYAASTPSCSSSCFWRKSAKASPGSASSGSSMISVVGSKARLQQAMYRFQARLAATARSRKEVV